MKSLVLLAFILGITGLLYAANINQPTSSGPSVLTAAQILYSTPTYAGQQVVCSDCKNYGQPAGYALCVGTETVTARNGYIIQGSSTAANVACQ